MRYKIAAIIFGLIGLYAIGNLSSMGMHQFFFFGSTGYFLIFVLLPFLIAWGTWQKKVWALKLGLYFFILQIVNIVGIYTFTAPIPISLTLYYSSGSFGIILNLFALVMSIFLAFNLSALKKQA